MAKVTRPFTLLTEGGVPRSFSVGENVAGELASHWYVVHHCDSEAQADESADSSADPVRTKKRGKQP